MTPKRVVVTPIASDIHKKKLTIWFIILSKTNCCTQLFKVIHFSLKYLTTQFKSEHLSGSRLQLFRKNPALENHHRNTIVLVNFLECSLQSATASQIDFGNFFTIAVVKFSQIFCNFWGTNRCVSEAGARRCSVKNMFLKISKNSTENICVGICFCVWVPFFFPEACNFIGKETPDIWKISKYPGKYQNRTFS